MTTENINELKALEIHAQDKRMKRQSSHRNSNVDTYTNSTTAGGVEEVWEEEDYTDEYLIEDYTVTNNALLALCTSSITCWRCNVSTKASEGEGQAR